MISQILIFFRLASIGGLKRIELSQRNNNNNVVNLLAAIFGDQRIKVFREKGESKTVFSHLKLPCELN